MPTGVYKHRPASLATKQKMSLVRKGKPQPLKLGNKYAQKETVTYASVHKWIAGRLGHPRLCENCGTIDAKKFEWANLSSEYKRDVSDWARLCTRCHRLVDGSWRLKVRPEHEQSMIGQKYYKLTVIKYIDKGVWLFKCDCGVEKAIRKGHVNAGKIKSCGCYMISARRLGYPL